MITNINNIKKYLILKSLSEACEWKKKPEWQLKTLYFCVHCCISEYIFCQVKTTFEIKHMNVKYVLTLYISVVYIIRVRICLKRLWTYNVRTDIVVLRNSWTVCLTVSLYTFMNCMETGEFRIHQSSVQRKVFEGHDFQNIIYHLKHGNCWTDNYILGHSRWAKF